jgi:hypothetical protein
MSLVNLTGLRWVKRPCPNFITPLDTYTYRVPMYKMEWLDTGACFSLWKTQPRSVHCQRGTRVLLLDQDDRVYVQTRSFTRTYEAVEALLEKIRSWPPSEEREVLLDWSNTWLENRNATEWKA